MLTCTYFILYIHTYISYILMACIYILVGMFVYVFVHVHATKYQRSRPPTNSPRLPKCLRSRLTLFLSHLKAR